MQRVDPSQWLPAVTDALARGFTGFVTLLGIDDDGLQVWLRLRNTDGEDLVLATSATGPLPSIVGVLPAAGWCQREAAETFGITFSGDASAPLILAAGSEPTMRKSTLLAARQVTPWPGEKEPGGVTARRRTLPPGVDGGAR